MSTVVGPLCTRGHQSADEFQCEGVVEGDSAVGEGCADCGEGDVGGGVGGGDGEDREDEHWFIQS